MATLTASQNGLRPRAAAAATLLETLALSCALAGVVGVLPLVMYLRG